MGTYVEIESSHDDKIVMTCPDCHQVIKKRKDTYLPGLHQVICLACNHVDSEITLLTGEHRVVTAADHRPA